MKDLEITEVEQRIGEICKKVSSQHPELSDVSDDFLIQIVLECHKEGLDKGGSEIVLQDRYGDSQQFFELFEGTWESSLSEEQVNLSSNPESALFRTSCFPESVYQALPDLLQKSSEAFTEARQKDTFLTSALSTLSSLLRNVSGIYFNELVRPVIYSFVVAPAASGKSAMKYAGTLIDPIHRMIIEQSRADIEEYKKEIRKYEQRLRKNEAVTEEPPVEPKFKTHRIPGNSSRASIISHLEANSGGGLIIETESDSLSKMFSSEWGDFSELIRKGFHHEHISVSRKTNHEFFEIENPCFSMCLTGTPGQVLKMVDSVENGMFSRMTFYAFESPTEWLDPSPSANGFTLNEHFEKLGMETVDIYKYFQQDEFRFELADAHWDMLNSFFKDKLHSSANIYGEETSSIVKRLGLVCFRIAMLLTAIEHFESGVQQKILRCSHSTFNASLKICEVLLEHSLLVFDKLPKSSNSSFSEPDERERFFQSLPQSFRRMDAQRMAKGFCVGKARAVDALLTEWVKTGLLVKPITGTYQKVTTA